MMVACSNKGIIINLKLLMLILNFKHGAFSKRIAKEYDAVNLQKHSGRKNAPTQF